MPGYLVQVGATIQCTHGGQVTIVSSNTRVMLGGQAAATASDTFTVAGCAFTVGTKPQPCVKLQWVAPATRVKINGDPAVLQSSTGICQSAEQAPQGPPTVVSTQTRASGT